MCKGGGIKVISANKIKKKGVKTDSSRYEYQKFFGKE